MRRKINKKRFTVNASKSIRRGRKIMASTSGAYDYLKEMVDDIIDRFDEYDFEYDDREELEERMNDAFWTDDSVTGNGSGSYFFNREKARDAVRGNEDLLVEAIEEFGDSTGDYKKALTEPEWADVTIRCYLLGQAIGEALDRMGIE